MGRLLLSVCALTTSSGVLAFTSNQASTQQCEMAEDDYSSLLSHQMTKVSSKNQDFPDEDECREKQGAVSNGPWRDKALVTRLWKILKDQTSQNVVDTFRIGFSKEIVQQEGFINYLGSPVSLRNSFFSNVFEDLEKAQGASLKAAEFADENLEDVANEIFTSGNIGFHIVDAACEAELPDYTGKYVSIRHWECKGSTDCSVDDIVHYFQAGFGPTISEAPGFNMYLGAKVRWVNKDGCKDKGRWGSKHRWGGRWGAKVHEDDCIDKDVAFFMNIFDELPQAIQANKLAVDFAKGVGEFEGTVCGGLVAGDEIGIAELVDTDDLTDGVQGGVSEGLIDFNFHNGL
eukprot:TRINITY_DN8893_c0_g5_i1.p1 TRINITY_DN8893_c0_g5~~TRINITY_DN8893_c0_g5_i1.p1  ORF type:complete len:345 (+),score=80.31 TRINITY_DN8893_c0_g5_i1:45-1079(+)